MNQSITQILRAQVQPCQCDWLERLPMVEFVADSSVNQSTRFAPFDLIYGYIPTVRFPVLHTLFDGVRHFVGRATAERRSPMRWATRSTYPQSTSLSLPT